MTTQITDIKSMSDDELKQHCLEWWKLMLSLSFSVDINELYEDKVRHYQDLLRDADNTTLRFESCPPDEPTGEI